jgi:hypothetical protein
MKTEGKRYHFARGTASPGTRRQQSSGVRLTWPGARPRARSRVIPSVFDDGVAFCLRLAGDIHGTGETVVRVAEDSQLWNMLDS